MGGSGSPGYIIYSGHHLVGVKPDDGDHGGGRGVRCGLHALAAQLHQLQPVFEAARNVSIYVVQRWRLQTCSAKSMKCDTNAAFTLHERRFLHTVLSSSPFIIPHLKAPAKARAVYSPRLRPHATSAASTAACNTTLRLITELMQASLFACRHNGGLQVESARRLPRREASPQLPGWRHRWQAG